MADATCTDLPIFVVGFQRSGTTLLQALIGAHSRVAAPPEVHFLLRISWLADYYGDLADDANLRHAVHDTLHPPLDLLDGCGFEVCAFIGEEFEPEMLHDLSRRRSAVATTAEAWQGGALREVAPADVDGWKRRLSRAQRGELALEVQPLLRRLGYPGFGVVDRAVGLARQRRTRSDDAPGTTAELAPPAERYRMTQQYLSAQAATLADDGA